MSNLCAAAVVTPWENVIFCKHPTSAEIYHDSSGGYIGELRASEIFKKIFFKKKVINKHIQTNVYHVWQYIHKFLFIICKKDRPKDKV